MTKKNPWRGLASYDEPQGTSDDYLFCGRDEETMDLVRLIDNNLFVTLYGSSGIGKTSLLKAGVIPILRRKDYYPLYVRLSQEPEEFPYAEAIVRKLQNSGLKEEHSISLEHSNGHDRLYLWNYFATTRFFNADGREVYPVIILDQFEEVFRDADKRKAELLLQQIYLLLNDELEMPDSEGYNTDTNYRFLASIREDFLFVLEDSIDELSFDLYKNNRYRLRAMNSEQARQVVLGPGKGCIEPENSETIANQIVSLAERNRKNDIDTLLLSLICSELYNVANQKKTIITKNLIDQLGDDILGSFYGNTISSVSNSTIVYLEEHLLTQSGFRNSVAYEDILHDGISKDDIEKLVSMRLLCIQRSSGVERVEFTHDALCKMAKKHRDTRLEGKQKRKDIIVGLRFAAITTISILLPLACLLKEYKEFGDYDFLWMIRKAPIAGLVLVSFYAIFRIFFIKNISDHYKKTTKYLITGVLSFLMINDFFIPSPFIMMNSLIPTLIIEILLLIAYFAERSSNNSELFPIIKYALLLALLISIMNISVLLSDLVVCLLSLCVLYPYCYTKEKNAFWTSFTSLFLLSSCNYAPSVSYLLGYEDESMMIAMTILSVVISAYYLISFKRTKSSDEAWDYCISLNFYEKHPFFIKYTSFLLLFCLCFIAFIIGLTLHDKCTILGISCLGIASFILVYFLLFRDSKSLRSNENSWVKSIRTAMDTPPTLRFHYLLLAMVVLIALSFSQYLRWHLLWMISLWMISALIIVRIYNKNRNSKSIFKHIILWFVPFVFVPLLCFGYNVFTLPQYARVYKGTINIGSIFRFMKIKSSDESIGLRDRTNIVIPAEYKRIMLFQYYAKYLGGAKFPYSLEKIEGEYQAYQYPGNSVPKILFLTIDSEGDNHVWDCSEHLSMNNICSNVILSDYENILKYNPRLGQKGIFKFYLNSLVDRNIKKQDVSKKALLFLNNTLNSVGIEVDAKGKVNYNSIDKVDLKTMLRTIDESSQLFPYLENFSAIERQIIDSIIPKCYDYDSLAHRIDYAGIARWRMLSQDYSKAESDARKSLKESSSPYNYAHIPLIESFYFTQQYDSAFLYLDKYLNKECFVPFVLGYLHSQFIPYIDTARGPSSDKRIFLGDAIWQDFQFYKKMGWISDTLSPSYLMLMSKLKDNANNRPYSYALRRGWGDTWGEENSYYYLCQYYNDNEYLTNNDFYQYIMYDNKPVSPCYRRYSYCWPSIDFNRYEYLTQKFGTNHLDDPYRGWNGYSDYIDRTLLVINADNHKRQYIDITNGPPKPIPGSFDHAWLFSEGMAVVAIGDSIGIINTDGEYVIQPSIKCRLKYSKYYKEIENSNFIGSYSVRGIQNWEYKLPTNKNFVFQHGLCPMVNDQGLYGLIDKNGDWKVEPEYTYIDYLVKGYRIIKKGDKYGLMDDSSNILLPVVFDRINYPDKYIFNYLASTVIVIDGEEYPISDLQERIHEIIDKHTRSIEDLTFTTKETEQIN